MKKCSSSRFSGSVHYVAPEVLREWGRTDGAGAVHSAYNCNCGMSGGGGGEAAANADGWEEDACCRGGLWPCGCCLLVVIERIRKSCGHEVVEPTQWGSGRVDVGGVGCAGGRGCTSLARLHF